MVRSARVTMGCMVPKVEFLDVFTFFLMGDLDSDAVRTALLRKQYLPNVKSAGEELPPLFSSDSFSVDCAKELAGLGRDHRVASWTELRTRRFDGLVRRLGIPHPVPYARLVLHIGDNWANLAPLLASPQSQIKPSFHTDGRMVQMDYETSESSLNRETRLAHGQQFMVKADVSNCFPSLYSHAIDWAARGKQAAKSDRSQNTWQAKLDTLVRNCHDSETKGVMIGPAFSNILAELVLQRVDEVLVKKGHEFVRYIDDYKSYCGDRSAAETFVVDLQRALSTYRLDLNTRKTRIVDLREGIGEPWMAEVRSHLPMKASPLAAARFLRQAELVASQYPLYSVLKFAVKTLIGRRESDSPSSMLVIDELLRLCVFHPHLAPFVSSEIASIGQDLSHPDQQRIGRVIERQMLEAAERGETDVVLWHLYTLRRILKLQVKKPAWTGLLKMDDDLVATGLAVLCPRSRPAVKARVLGWDYLCTADYQQHWLTRYELRRVGLLLDSDLDPAETVWMKVLIKHGVQFSELAS